MIKYSDVYVSILVKGLCQPGEQFVGACAVNHQPFWSFGIPFFKHALLLVATSHRLMVLDHRKGLLFDRLDRVDNMPWPEISALKLSGVLSKKVVVKDRSNRTVIKGKVTGMLGPLAKNGVSARTLVQAWEQHARLPAPPAHAALPSYAAV